MYRRKRLRQELPRLRKNNRILTIVESEDWETVRPSGCAVSFLMRFFTKERGLLSGQNAEKRKTAYCCIPENVMIKSGGV